MILRGDMLLFRPNGLKGKSLSSQRSKDTTAVGKSKLSANKNARPQLVYGVMGGLVIAVVAGVSHMHEELGGLEGLSRSLSFYSVAIPRYVEYRLLQLRDAEDEEWEELDHRASQDGLDKILELRGFYIKTGQMAANNIGNAFPKIWQERFSILQDWCPHKDFSVVRSIVEDDMGKPLSQVFASFDEVPIGAASIGQVHRATLLNGDQVVVKVMYPEVEDMFRGDVRTLKMFCQLAQPVHVPALEMVEKHFLSEFDYKKEADQQFKIRHNLIRAGLAGGGNKLCAVPKVYRHLCTSKVMVMEEFEGEKLADGLRRDFERHAVRTGKTLEQLRQEEEEKDLEARAMGVLRRGPSAKEFERYISLLDAKRKIHNAGAILYNMGVSWWFPGSSWKQYQNRKILPLNQAKMIDDLIYIFGYQVLVDGYFNGDPHPGNILLLGVEEGHPKLGLIDYGQVGSLTKRARLLFCRLVIALADDNRREIVSLMKQAGFKSKNMNEEVIYKYGKVYYDDDNPHLTGGLHIQVFVENLEKIDPILQIPEDFIMIGRASIMLRGLAHALHQSRSIAKAWKPMAQKVLHNEGELSNTSTDDA